MSQRRLAAILSLDVVGYSRMMQGGSAPLLKTLNALFRDLITPVVQAGKGRVVKLLGDGALIEFPSAGEALEAAIAIQTRLREPDHPYQARARRGHRHDRGLSARSGETDVEEGRGARLGDPTDDDHGVGR